MLLAVHPRYSPLIQLFIKYLNRSHKFPALHIIMTVTDNDAVIPNDAEDEIMVSPHNDLVMKL